jgi:hypothetical protein
MSYNAYGWNSQPSSTRSGQTYQPVYNEKHDATTVYQPNSSYTQRVNSQYSPAEWKQAMDRILSTKDKGGRKTRMKRRKTKGSRRR